MPDQAAPLAAPMLSVRGLKVAYGGIQADQGELVALIGANGAGKTTTLKAITAGVATQAGDITFMGRSLRGQQASALVSQGLVMVPEGRGVFGRMTITENLMMGAYSRRGAPDVGHDIERMFAIFPRLSERAEQLAGTLSGGEQQMLARALMGHPRLLLLDEPSMGLSPIMVEKIFEVIRSVSAQGTTLLLVEQNAKLALQAAHRCYVMDSGVISMSGPAQDMLHDPRVREAYLGEAPG